MPRNLLSLAGGGGGRGGDGNRNEIDLSLYRVEEARETRGVFGWAGGKAQGMGARAGSEEKNDSSLAQQI